MASQTNGEDDFTHHIAIQLSRALNLVNPNDLLARRVQDIAKTNTVEGFIAGAHSLRCTNCSRLIYVASLASKSFGKFKDSFLSELHAEILSHAKQEAAGNPSQPVQGIVVHDSDVLEPEPVRQGGLMRKDAVSAQAAYRSHRILNVYTETYVPCACKTARPTDTTSLGTRA